jgi:hypothetical protein
MSGGSAELDIRIVAGGTVDAVEESAIVLAVRQVLRARDGRLRHGGSAWARAGRLEALQGRRVGSAQQLTDLGGRPTG